MRLTLILAAACGAGLAAQAAADEPVTVVHAGMRLADLVAVDAGPREDITEFERVRAVIRDGSLACQRPQE